MIYRPLAMGGLWLPNLWLYYLSARLLQLAQWHTSLLGIPWLRFERTSIAPYFLSGLLWATSIRHRDISSLNAVVGQSLYLWSLYKKKFFLLPPNPRLASFLGDLTFKAAFPSSNAFALWSSKDLVTLESLQKDGVICPFSTLQSAHSLPRTDFYKYLQIRHFFNTHYPHNNSNYISTFEDLCGPSSRDKGMISRLYNYLGGLGLPEKSTAMLGWEAETGQVWSDRITNIHKCTKSVAVKETVVKLHMRWYYTPSKLHKFFPAISENCFRGCPEKGTHTSFGVVGLLVTYGRNLPPRWQRSQVQ